NDAVADATNRVAGMGFLTVESDPLFAGWLTNSAAGSTNAVLSDGALVDIGELLGETTEADTLAAVTARGATTPTAITVSNDVTVGTGHFLYAPLFRSYSGASFGSSACWTTAPYRYEFGMCPEMQAFVFNPCGAATNSATHWPLVIVATPGKRTQYNMYSEALRVETNGNVTLGGDLDMGGYSVLNVGTGTIHFVDGSRISAPAVQRWDRASGGARRAEGPASALAIYLAGWLAGKRKRAWDWLRRLRKVAPVLLLVLAGASAFGDQQNDVHILVEAHGQEGAGGEWCEQIFSDGSRVGSCGHLRAPTDLLPLSAADLAEIKTAISALATSVLDYVETSGLMQHYMLHFYDLRVCPDEGRSIMIENLFDGVGNGCREERRLRGSHAEKIRKHIGRAPL
ncbi:MAG: hypothetical protein M0R74_09075, partial [Dehalococcoidia bacterium]|nr:hypothetical protein [Dehalococcoidia bacterium]